MEEFGVAGAQSPSHTFSQDVSGGELDGESREGRKRPKRMEKARSAGNFGRYMASTAFGSSMSLNMSLGTATDGDRDREKDKAKDRDMDKDEDKGIDKTTRRNEKSVNSLPHTSTLPRSNCMTNELKCIALCCAVLYCTVLYCTVLYCTVLCCTVLYWTSFLIPSPV